MEEKWFSKSLKETAKKLETDIEKVYLKTK